MAIKLLGDILSLSRISLQPQYSNFARLACVKSRTPKEQSTIGAEQFLNVRVLIVACSVALEKEKKNFKHIHFPSGV